MLPPDLIIYDEAHHVAAGTWDKIYKAFPQAFHVGLTATPERLDGKGLRPWFQEIIYGPPVRWLIDNGYLSDYKIFAPGGIDRGQVNTSGEFNRKKINDIIATKPQIVGDAVREYKRYAYGKRCVAFCHNVKKSIELVADFNANGIPAAHVDGDTDRDLRDMEINKFKAGQTLILSNVDLFGEGFDVPSIDGVILMRPTNSLGLYLQQVGRALRPFPGKEYAIILDHVGNVAAHGLPDDPRNWSLDGKAGRRIIESDGPGVKICPRCFAAQRSGPPKCSHCSFEFEIKGRVIKHVPGELEELNLDLFKGEQQSFPPGEILVKPKVYSMQELRSIAVDRGLNRPDTWAKHVFNEQQRRKITGGGK